MVEVFCSRGEAPNQSSAAARPLNDWEIDKCEGVLPRDPEMSLRTNFDCALAYAPTSDYGGEEVEALYVELEKFYTKDHTYKVFVGRLPRDECLWKLSS
ncbi:unnamed protein product [Heligmosomoides polygyrus]|uniref:SAWADEE domain-containing protein n=1 Tax=Heligmosomoides polygyrus TaxID=6339 RepID=A0A183G600_HELPZ|nr:unnamed protein product [Heligmosomoides polygyrus]